MFIFTATLAAATMALAFIDQTRFVTPAIGTNAAVSVHLDNRPQFIAGTVRRTVFTLTGDPGASGTVELVDFDGTVLLATNLTTGTPATITGDFVAFKPSLILTNSTTTNVTATAVFTFEQ